MWGNILTHIGVHHTYKEATCKSSTIEGLLYAANPEKRQKGTLSDQPPTIVHHIHGNSVPLGTTVAQRYESLGTDFETHVIWQGYVEDLAAKDFIPRKACTIALSKSQGTQQ